MKILKIIINLITALVFTAGAGEVVIAKSTVKTLKTEDVKSLFLGTLKTWPDGSKVTIVTLKSGDIHENFIKTFTGKSGSQFSNYWKQLVFTGKGSMPNPSATEDELVQFIAKTDGAIGYVSDAKVSSLPAGVIVIKVE